jgi:thiamine-phosphate pyrophosphorylase
MTSTRRVRGLYAIADTARLDPTRLTAAVALALDGGARVIQYRDKSRARAARAAQAAELRALCKVRTALFIVNDDVDLARAVNADGVHLGRDDPALAIARRALGPHAIIGMSCYDDLASAERAAAAGADYLAFGSFFASPTKPNAVRATPALLRDARARLDLPLVAIGGITPENGAMLIAAGADALAAISGVFGQGDVELNAKRYAALFDSREPP